MATTEETIQKIHDTLTKECKEIGLDICEKILCGWYKEVAPPTAPLLIDGGEVGDETIAFLIGGSKILWTTLLKAYATSLSTPSSSSPLHQEGDPLDTHIKNNLESILSTLTTTHSLSPPPQIFFSWEVSPGRLLSFGKLATCSSLCYEDKNTHLALHPTYGPWLSFKALIVFPTLSQSLPHSPSPPSPVSPQVLENAKKAIEEALSAPPGNPENWKLWVRVRDVVAGGEGHCYRYEDDEIKYYYGKRDFEGRHRFLKGCLVERGLL